MKPAEIFAVFVIIILVSYIILRWIYKTQQRTGNGGGGGGGHRCDRHEGFETASTEPYPDNKTAFNDPKNLPLKEYAIFASFNSAYDGNETTIQQLAKVMYSGCRFIDLNVFHADDELYVGYSRDNSPYQVDTSLKLIEAIQYINTYAFAIDKDAEAREAKSFQMKFLKDTLDPGSENAPTIQKAYMNYPLFLNIRVYRPPKTSFDILGKTYEAISGKNGLKNLYTTNGVAAPVTKYTPLQTLSKKIIVSVDFQNILQIYSGPPPYDAKNIPPETKEVMNKMANIRIGGAEWNSFYSYADVNKNANQTLINMDNSVSTGHSYETNTNDMKLVYPSYSDEMANPDAHKYIKNYKIQTIPIRFYINDTALDKYVRLFSDNKTPFLPLYHANNDIINKMKSPTK
jgi:hypothetical protein